MRKEPSIDSMIRFSWAKSLEILFPFHFKRWFKIMILVWLAGVGIQGFSANFKAPAQPARASSASQKITFPKPPSVVLPPVAVKTLQVSSVQIPPLAGTPGPSMVQVPTSPRKGMQPISISQNTDFMAKLREKMKRPDHKPSPFMPVLLIAGVVVLGVGLVAFMILFFWLSSRFNFVFLDMIATGVPAIKEPFKKYKEAGNSYFFWTLAFLGVSILILSIVGLSGAGLLMVAKGNVAFTSKLGFFIGLLASLVILTIVSVGITMRDFVVPIMCREKIPAMSALHKFMKAKTFAFGRIFQYLLVIFGFWIVVMAVQSVVSLIVAIGGLIAGGILVIPGIWIIKALPLLKVPLILFGGLMVGAIILAVIAVIGMIMLPAVIFFRVFALAYLTRLYPECDLLGFLEKNP